MFSEGFILLELEIISSLPIIFKLCFRRSGFVHYLEKFSRSFGNKIVKFGNKGQWDFAGRHYYQEILFDQSLLHPSLFSIASTPIFLLSLCILRESVVFDFITCVGV